VVFINTLPRSENMDYTVNLNSSGIELGEDVDVSTLGWYKGDTFKLYTFNGKATLIKIGSKGDRNETND
jgi:hypothetical protein